MGSGSMVFCSVPNSPITFKYPSDWILVSFPPLHTGGAFFDLHNRISALESTPKEETGLVVYKPGDFSLRLLVYLEGWVTNAYQTVRVEGQRLHQYHYVVSEPARVQLGEHDAAQVVFGTSARDGAFIVVGLDPQRWVLASLSAAVGELALLVPTAHEVLQTVKLSA